MTIQLTRRAFFQHSATGCAVALGAPLCGRVAGSRELDVIVRGGRVIDGTGAAAVVADVGITAERITDIGNLRDARAGREIDARGLVVAPGFIDVHAHTSLLRDPRAQSKVLQGVTLDVTGPDGSSPFPRRLAPGEKAPITEARACSSLDAWAKRYKRLGVNLASYVGHGTVRNLALGPIEREPTAVELDVMRELVRRALDEGALGLSSGLEYNPAGFAKTAELIALAEVAAEFGRPYVTHIRNEDHQLLEAVDEAIEICRRSGAPLLISHMKVGGKPNWHKIDALIERLGQARDDGLEIRCDRYPYEAWSTSLSINFPGWAMEGGAFRERLRDPAQRARMKEETLRNVDANGGWGVLMISGGVTGEDRALIGQRLDAIAEARGVDPFELACDLLAVGRVSIIGYGMSEENTDRIIALPWCMIASDGSALPAAGGPGGHPRSFGTFPRAIRRYVREKKLVSLEEMVRKMTSLPAEAMNLTDRGRLRKGCAADVVVFDAERITDTATYVDAKQYAQGVRYLIVNGQLTVDAGKQTKTLSGRVVRAARR